MDTSANGAIETLQDRVDWFLCEIERLKEVVREQGERNGTVTARVAIVHEATGPTFVVTCPTGDEARLMRMMFAGLAAVSWTGFSMAAEALGINDVADAARVLFGEDAMIQTTDVKVTS